MVGVLLVAAGALIQAFDLEGGGTLNVAQTVAGYFVISLVCLLMGVYTLSFS